jgi:hypothetical protein
LVKRVRGINKVKTVDIDAYWHVQGGESGQGEERQRGHTDKVALKIKDFLYDKEETLENVKNN